ncbi:L,D-transpeptidase [Neotabrizicola sp. sgz301269]|uniref:L,D-transpeptidase n=1 Tax=Neotabrizicola sp. sgz301269 TaxID=3276282 RepID=UPI00376FEFFA
MRLPGILSRAPTLKSASAALLSALLLSACVEGGMGAAPGTPAQAPVVTDETIYAARSDGQFTVPALPVAEIPEPYRRQVVEYPNEQVPGTIIIDPSKRLLYYVLDKKKAIRYGIAVGAEGFGWSGESVVANKRTWPTWTPPKEMIERKPHLKQYEKGQPGGPTNPLGSRAIYLTSGGVDYGYRIHGTPEWKSIGRNASSGCFRMINQDVMDLYDRVQGGEKVIVLTSKGEIPKGLSIPKPPAPKKKEAPVVTPVVAPPLAVLTPPTIAGGPGTGLATPTVEPAAAPAADTPPAAPAPAADPAPAAEPAAPAAAPEAPAACPVPLVNGACPQG